MNYLFDAFIIILPMTALYTVTLAVMFLLLHIVNHFRVKSGKRPLITKGHRRVLLVPYLLFAILGLTSDSVTWKNSLNTTETSIERIEQYNRERQIPKIVDQTKQPGANSEELKRELESKTQEWKNNSKSEKID